MKFRYILTICILLAIQSIKAYAQTDPGSTPPNIVPLSPNAAEFAKYGNIPVSPTTGTPNISIPIYEINTGKISVPISLSYHASGIQVSQKATWVGLGWSLNAGGVISRSVRGLPDEATYGWMNEQNTTQTILNSQDPVELGRYADNASDSHPDFFSYNLPDLAGRFIYSQTTSSFQTIPSEPIKVLHTTSSSSPNLNNTYQITDADGTNYYFRDKQSYFNDSGGTGNQYVQSWYLSTIVSADTKDTVQFNYTTSTTAGGTNEQMSESEVRTYTSGDNNNVYTDKGAAINQTYFYHSYIALKEIIFRQGKVTFEATTARRDYLGYMLDGITVYSKASDGSYSPVYKYRLNHDYFTTSQPVSDEYDYRLRLNSLSKLSLNSNATETHQFVYNSTSLPSINARACDYWGFYNGPMIGGGGYLPQILPTAPELSQFAQSNQYVGGANRDESDAYIEAGILQKIIYPTGGYTVFNYEAHQYTSDLQQTITSTIANVKLTGIGKNHITNSTTNITWPSNASTNVGTINIVFSANTNPGAIDVPQRATLTDLTTGSNVGVWEHTGDNTKVLPINTGATFNATHSYQLTLLVDDNSPTYVSFSLTAPIQSTNSVTKKGGGLRVSSIQNFNTDNSIVSTQAFTYNGVSIGKNDVLLANNYNKKTFYRMLAGGGGMGCSYVTYYSIYYIGTPGYGGQNFEGANVLYNDVLKTDYDSNNKPNGRTEYTYNTDRAFASIFNPTMPGGREYIDNSLGMTSLPQSEGIYKYNPDGSFALLKSKLYSYGGPGYFFEGLQQVTRNYYWVNGASCLITTSPAGEAQTEFTRYDYHIGIGPTKLTSLTETDYSNSSAPVATTTQYEYANPNHLQITKITGTSSDGKSVVTQNKYPADYSDNTYGSDQLRNQSINNVILEQTITKGGTQTSKTAKHYASNQGSVLPDYAMKALTNGTMETRLTFDQYDGDGKNLQISVTANTSTSQKTAYLWGYNRSYPVAAVKNASYQDLLNILGQTNINQLNSSYGNDATLRNMLATLRTALPNAQVTTYTYSPLVGMTSMTDAKGMTTYYEYDGFQRLMNIKDKDGNILKHMDYHYQGQ